jgi:hypothetical protein
LIRYDFSITLESALEINYFNLRHYENNFPFFEMQPNWIFYNGKLVPRTPYAADDRYIDEDGEEHLDEVKYFCDANKSKDKLKHKLIEQHCNDIGIHFSVITEIDIRVGERASNLRYLYPCLAMPSPAEELTQLCSKFLLMKTLFRNGVKRALKMAFSIFDTSCHSIQVAEVRYHTTLD